ncbi:MAG: MCE family protein, partial [Alphaproteobacteria bacterium]|nr:MCE family protein [Alphaproteobacteria bacterium]
MSDPQIPTRGPVPPSAAPRRPRIPFVWLVPVVALAIAGFLAWRSFSEEGSLITLTFETANGLSAGVTQVRHKSVALGTVRDIRLSQDMSHVIVHVRMSRDATPILTDHAQFWVVRPRLSAGYVQGLETLVSGAYIDVDPGPPGGKPQTNFKGLETPPSVRSDEPGHTYVLTADRVGGIGPGSPVLYRDLNVGEVLSYDVGADDRPAILHVFVRAPFDQYVHVNSQFWKAGGVTINYGAQGLHVELESLQAALSGGLTFDTPQDAPKTPVADNNAPFTLFADHEQAIESGYRLRVPLLAYFQSSVAGLAPGSPVDLFGLDIGRVTAVTPHLAPDRPEVEVAMELQPERAFHDATASWRDPGQVLQHLVANGLRAELSTRNFITGQEAVSLEFVPGAAAAEIGRQGDAFVVPSQPGGAAGLVDAVSAVAAQLAQVPFGQIAGNLNQLLANANQTLGSADMRTAIRSLSATLQDLQKLVRQTNSGLTPALDRLPAISEQLQQAMTHANELLGNAGGSYGANSDFHRDLEQLMEQASDAARSVRMLADFLNRHPEALVRG